MKTTLLACFASSLLAGVLPIGAIAADSPALKYGLCINFGLQTFAKSGEQGELPASRFAPASVNVKSWVRAAKAAGMTFAVALVNSVGFCLWPTADDDYDIAHSPFKGDILGDFIAACNAEGILPGAFYFVSNATTKARGEPEARCPIFTSTLSRNRSRNSTLNIPACACRFSAVRSAFRLNNGMTSSSSCIASTRSV